MALTYNIQFNADTKSVKSQVAALQKDLAKAFEVRQSGGMSTELNAAVKSAQVLETVLKRATTINGTSFTTMNAELKKAGTSAAEIVTNLSGAQMRNATSQFIETFTFASRSAVVLSGHIKEMGRVLTQSFKFTAAQGFLRFLTTSLESGLRWSKDMNKALTDISIVTGNVGDDLDKVFSTILDGAEKLNVAAKEYAEASLIFYQQGLGDKDVENRADITVKAAKAAGQATKEMSQQLTAIWNTYKMQGEELERAASVGARLGAETAVDFKYIAEAMQISASAASQLGVSYESLAAITATVGETSMQSASLVGNAYKTIFARFANLKTTGEDEGVTLGRITEQFADMGIHVLDAAGDLKELDDVIMDVGESWGDYSTKQQQAIAQIAGGTRQFGQFLSLMNNFDKYKENLASANSEIGGETLNTQFDTWADSIEASANLAKEAWAQAFAEMFQQDSIKGFYDLVAGLGSLFGEILAGVGGLSGILLIAGSIMSKQIVGAAANLLITSKELVLNATLSGRVEQSNLNIKQQIAATEAAILVATAKGNITQAEELTLTQEKLAVQKNISADVIMLQNLKERGNQQQKQEATVQLEILQISQSKLHTALDTDRALEMELTILKETGSIRNSLTQSQETALKKKIEELELEKQINSQRLANARVAMDANASDAGRRVQDLGNPAGVINYGQALSGLAMSAMTATFAINSVASAAADGKVTFGEVTGILLTVGITLSTLVRSLGALGLAFTKNGIQSAAQAAIIVASQRAAQVAQEAAVAAAAEQVIAEEALTAALLKQAAAQQTLDAASAKGIPSKKKKNAARRAGEAVAAAEIASETAATAATSTAAASTAAGTAATGAAAATSIAWLPLIAIIAGVAAVIYVVYQAWQEIENQKPERQLKDAKEAASKLKEELDEATTSAKNLSEAFDKFKSLEDNLDRLTIGTTEWKNALKDANNAALDLLNTYPELIAYADKDDFGKIEISDEGMKAVKAEAEATIDQAKIASMIGNQRLRDAQSAVDRESLTTRIQNENGSGTYISNNPNAMQSSDEKAANALSNTIKEFTGVLETDKKTFAEQLKAQGIQGEDSLNDYIDQFTKTHSSIADWQTAIEQNTAIRELENETSASDILGDSIAGPAQDQIIKAAGRTLESLTDKYAKEFTNKAESRNIFDMGKADAKEMWEMYAKERGLDKKGAKVTNYKGDGNVEYEYTKEDGTVEKQTITAEQIGNTLAAAKASEELASKTSKLVEQYNRLSTSTKDADQAMVGFLAAQDFFTATKTEFDDLRREIENAESAMGYLQQKFDVEQLTDDEVFNLSGYKNAEAWAAGLESGIETTTAQLRTFQVPPNIIAFDDLQIGTQKKMADLYKEVGLGAMSDGGSKMVEHFNKILEDLNPKDQAKALEALVSVDWSRMGSVKEATNALEGLGIELNLTDDELKQFAKDMEKMNNVSKATMFQDLKITLQEIAKIVGDLKLGDIIDDEAYRKIIAFNSALKDSFLLMADGSYKIIDNVDKINEIDLSATIAKMNAAQAAYENYKATDFGTGSKKDGDRVAFDWSKVADGTTKMSAESLTNLKDLTGSYEAMIEQAGYADERLQEIISDIESGAPDAEEQVKKLGEAVTSFLQGGASGAYGDSALKEMLASTAKDIDDLQDMLAEGSIDQSAFDKAFKGLKTSSLGELEIPEDAFDQYVDELEEVAKKEQAVINKGDVLEQNLQQVALEALEAAYALNDITSVLDDYEDVLKSGERSGMKYQKMISELTSSVGKLLDVDPTQFSKDFIDNNLALIQDAAGGSADAIEQLRAKAGEDIIQNIILNTEGLDTSELNKAIASLPTDIPIGVTLSGADLQPFQDIVDAAQMTQEQANAYFESIGYDPVLETKEVEEPQQQPDTQGIDYTVGRALGFGSMFDPIKKAAQPFMSFMPTFVPKIGKLVKGASSMGKTSVTAIGSESKKPSVVVKSVTKKASGGKIQSGRGAVPKSGGGGGGGGGGGSKPKANKMEKAEDFSERYRDLNDSLKTVNRSLERMNSAEESAFGLAKVAKIQKKNKQLQEQGAVYAKLRKEAAAYLKVDDKKENQLFGNKKLTGKMGDQGRLQQKLDISKVGVKATFDEYGGVSNVETILKGLAQVYGVSYRQLEALKGGSNEAFDEMKEKLGENAEPLKDIVEQIELIETTAETAEKALIDGLSTIKEWMANKITEVEYKVDLRMSINDRDIRLIDQTLSQLGSKQYGAFMAGWDEKTNSLVDNSKELFAGAKRYQEIMNNIKDPNQEKWFSAKFGKEAWDEYQNFGTVPADLMEAMNDNIDQMMDLKDSFYEINDQMWGVLHEALETYLSDFDNYLQTFDDHESMLKSWATIWEATGKQFGDASLSIDLLNKSIDNQSSKVKTLQEKLGFMKDQLPNAEQNYLLALDSQGADNKHTQEAYEKWQQLIADTHSMEAEVASGIADMMNMIDEAAIKSAENIRKTYNETFNGIFTDMAAANDMYNQKKAIDTFYLHPDDQKFELDQLTKEIGKEMEDVSDPEILENYSNWMDKINKLKEDGVKMTQADLDILKAEFDLDKSRAEFEDKQKAKNTMRLSRDKSGNWSYLYSNDNDESGDKEAEIEQKVHNIAKMHRDAADAAAEMWLQLNSDLEEYTANIDWKRYENDTKYRAEVDQRLTWFNEQLDQNAQQITSHNDAVNRSFDETTLGVITDMDSMKEANDLYKQNHEAMKEALKENHNEYQDKIKETLAEVNWDYDEMENTIRDKTEDIIDHNRDTEDSVEDLRNSANSNLDEMMLKVSDWSTRWKNEIRSIIDEINNLIMAQQKLNHDTAGSADTDFNWERDYTQELRDAQASGASDEVILQLEKELYNKLKAAYLRDISAFDGNEEYMENVRNKWNKSRYREGMTLEEFLAQDGNYDTGGLATGPQIKGLAMDGKKELVLNNSDTENFLEAISIMRAGISSYLKDIGARQATTISSIHSQAPQTEVSQTPVIIQADFPNVTAREEIEAAFSNLVNQAAQYQIKPRN